MISEDNMPGLDGITMLQRPKAKPALGKFPIFMLTTETSNPLKAAGKQVGVVTWMSKPLVPDTLNSLVTKVLAMKKAA